MGYSWHFNDKTEGTMAHTDCSMYNAGFDKNQNLIMLDGGITCKEDLQLVLNYADDDEYEEIPLGGDF